MKITVVHEITAKDIEMIKARIGTSPCNDCQSYICCGCKEGIAYQRREDEYKKNNIYEYAVLYEEYLRALKIIEENNKIAADVKDTLIKNGFGKLFEKEANI